MKKVLLVAVLLIGCKKKNSDPPKVSAVGGCVTCSTNYSVDGTPTKWVPFDTTICNVSDDILNAYITKHNYSAAYPPNQTEQFITTCK